MNSKGRMKMKAMELLNETMEELNLSEQMSINGGGINASNNDTAILPSEKHNKYIVKN